jgi:hypothetical protein
LDRDLYLNIIGRAGRANVSVEGLVFILDSEAPTLRGLVRGTLWASASSDSVKGRLGEIPSTSTTTENWAAFRDAQSQLLGWLGDGDSYVDDQASYLAQKTLSWHAGSDDERSSIRNLFEMALRDLENNGFALAGSPYQLTSRGRSARLSGLCVPTVRRLERSIERSQQGWLLDLTEIDTLTTDSASQIARLVFEGIEVAEHSLWLRSASRVGDGAKLTELMRMASGAGEDFYGSSEYRADI